MYTEEKMLITQSLLQIWKSNLEIIQGNICHVLKYRAQFKTVVWSNVRVGDIVFLEDGEQLPADIVIIRSSQQNGECFVQTSNLDGERALKHKQCLAPIISLFDRHGLENFECNLHFEAPHKNLYQFNGFVESTSFTSEEVPFVFKLPGGIQQNNSRRIELEPPKVVALDNKQLILRGSNLANTSWVVGVVVYSGQETKLMLNQGPVGIRHKQSKIETLVNSVCIYLIAFQALLCLIMAYGAGWFTWYYADLVNAGTSRKAEYIFYTQAGVRDNPDYYSARTAVLAYGQYFILINTIIPISLVVSLEFVKLLMTPFINEDVEMYDKESMKLAHCITMTLHEELASVKYIFADKTGTLTANIMQFKACSVAGVCYDPDFKQRHNRSLNSSLRVENPFIMSFDAGRRADSINIENPEVQRIVSEYNMFKKQSGGVNQGQEQKIRRIKQVILQSQNNSAALIIRALLESDIQYQNHKVILEVDFNLGQRLVLHSQHDYLNQFWLNVSLCHDVIAIHQGLDVQYQGTSPDEITLLDAAKEIGYVFLDRSSDQLKLNIQGRERSYRLLNKFEFTPERKRMTVIVQDEQSGLITVYCKGADLAIFELLSNEIEQVFLESTQEDLVKFATQGYRTLCFAMKIIDEDYYRLWATNYENTRYQSIQKGISLLSNQEDLGHLRLQNQIEQGLFLLGATALEDKLQDGVPEAIQDFREAGIKVWMLTGDKLETAENIGFSSKMFNENMYIFKLQTRDSESTKNRLNQIEKKMQEIYKSHESPVVGTQFILKPPEENLGINLELEEPRNIIYAIEEFQLASQGGGSQYTINDSWAQKPMIRRKIRKRLQEIAPDKQTIAINLVRENQLFYSEDNAILSYVPKGLQKHINREYALSKSKKIEKSDMVDDQFGLLIEGQTLHYIMRSQEMKQTLLNLLSECHAVIVCRASPSQKGQVVQLIKNNEPESITLAIGDGANDVNMIKRAHIGIGIFGKEGYQAASNSDYAIGQFRFLKRLMFVHGRWSGERLSLFLLLFFNKNMMFSLPQFWFGIFSGYSAQTMYDNAYLTVFNAVVTSIAICTLAISDQDINFSDPKTQPIVQFFIPLLYSDTRDNGQFTRGKFLLWMALSILQSLLIFGISFYAFDNHMFQNGMIQDLWAASTCAYFSIVLIHYLLLFSVTRNWTLWIAANYILSIIIFFPIFIFIYDQFIYVPLSSRLIEIVFSNYYFWLLMLIIAVVCYLPFYIIYNCKRLLLPGLKDLILQKRISQERIEVGSERLAKELCRSQSRAAMQNKIAKRPELIKENMFGIEECSQIVEPIDFERSFKADKVKESCTIKSRV